MGKNGNNQIKNGQKTELLQRGNEKNWRLPWLCAYCISTAMSPMDIRCLMYFDDIQKGATGVQVRLWQ